ITRVRDALRSASDQLRDEDDFAAEYVDKVSESITKVANYVSSADFSNLGRDAHQFARERPGLFFGGAFAVGLMVGRFLKSSAGESHPAETSSDRELPAGHTSFGEG